MKKLIEDSNEGFEALIGEVITVWCVNYIYTGKLTAISDSTIKLESPKVVYETGPLLETEWENAQALPNCWYVQVAAIESFGILK